MKTNPLLLWCGLVGFLASGCSTPLQVKKLAYEVQRATDHMANVHERDLQSLSAYDQARVAQFNSFFDVFFNQREDVARAFNDILNRSKNAVLDELDHKFDKRAEQLLAVDFWLAFREEANRELTALLRGELDKGVAGVAAANAHPGDLEAIKQSLLRTRQVYAGTAQKYEAVEGSYAELVLKIRKARSHYRLENEKRMATIQPLKLKDGAARFTLTNNAADIDGRIKELKPAYRKLSEAQAALKRYLDEYNPTADFLEGFVSGLVGATGQIAETTGTNGLSSVPAEPAGGKLPGLGELFSGMQEIAGSIGAKRGEGLEALGPAFQAVLDNFRPVIKLNPPAPGTGDGPNNKPN